MVYHQPGPVCEDSGRTSEKEAPQDADDHLCSDLGRLFTPASGACGAADDRSQKHLKTMTG